MMSVKRFYCRPSTIILNLSQHDSKMKEDELRTRRFIIDSQVSLRKNVQAKGDKFAEQIWQLRIQDKNHLEAYAANMFELSTNIWNRYKKMNLRISWTHENIMNYYKGKINSYLKEEKRMFKYFLEFRKDINRGEEFYGLKLNSISSINEPLQVLDVGSCYNPFGIYTCFNVTAIDICPAIPDVHECDFLTVKLKNMEEFPQISNSVEFSNIAQDFCVNKNNALKRATCDNNFSVGNSNYVNSVENCNSFDFSDANKSKTNLKIEALYKDSFHVIIFSLFIGYIPSPRLRHFCCQKAYDLLMENGLLCIITPVSFYPHINEHFVDLWKLTLGNLGFHCIKSKEFKHFHGLIFRKGICKELFQSEARRELDEFISRSQPFASNELKIFKNFDYNSIFKNFYIHQDLLGMEEKVS